MYSSGEEEDGCLKFLLSALALLGKVFVRLGVLVKVVRVVVVVFVVVVVVWSSHTRPSFVLVL